VAQSLCQRHVLLNEEDKPVSHAAVVGDVLWCLRLTPDTFPLLAGKISGLCVGIGDAATVTAAAEPGFTITGVLPVVRSHGGTCTSSFIRGGTCKCQRHSRGARLYGNDATRTN
jgi:hypothetical protein